MLGLPDLHRLTAKLDKEEREQLYAWLPRDLQVRLLRTLRAAIEAEREL